MAQNPHIWQNSAPAVSSRKHPAPKHSQLPRNRGIINAYLQLCESSEHFSCLKYGVISQAFITTHTWPLFQVAKTEMMRLFRWFVWVAIVLTGTIRLQNTVLFYRVHILFIAINNLIFNNTAFPHYTAQNSKAQILLQMGYFWQQT